MRISILVWQIAIGAALSVRGSANEFIQAKHETETMRLEEVTGKKNDLSVSQQIQQTTTMDGEVEGVGINGTQQEHEQQYLNHDLQQQLHQQQELELKQDLRQQAQQKEHEILQDPNTIEINADFEIQELKKDTNMTVATGFNVSTIPFTACEKLDMALEFMTSLDFQEHFEKVFSYSNPFDPKMLEHESEIYADIYVLQLIFTPIFVTFLLFGGSLFLHTFVICAAIVGLFGVFAGVEGLLPMQLDCPMKLALSIVASFLSAILAATFFRVGFFALNSLAFGGATYVIFDAFPHLDPGTIIFSNNQHAMPTSDLSVAAWTVTCFSSVVGGILCRYFEMAQLEIMTAGIGGAGCAYSIHTFFMIQGNPMDPSIVFLFAFFISLGGAYHHCHGYFQ